MLEQATTKASDTISHKIPIRQVTVPDQMPRPVRDAHAAARSLRGELAGFRDTVMNKTELEKAKREEYLLAVAPEGLPEKTGWHQVCRETASFKLISEDEARSLRQAGRWDEVLYVNPSAVNAAKKSRPLALDFYYKDKGYLDAYYWPDVDARVALAKPETAKMLRLGKGKVLQVTFRNGEKQLLSDVDEVQEME